MTKDTLIQDRLALNDDDAKVRRWFIEQVDKLGCEVTVSFVSSVADCR